MRPASAMLTVEHLEATYGDLQALFDVSLEVVGGELLAVMGSNGAGKSTLLKAIVGLVPPAAGSIRLDGEPIGGLSPDVIARRGVVLVPEGRRVFPSLTVEDNLLLGGYTRRRGPWDLRRVHRLFPVLADRRLQKGSQLSGGEQQMLAIARGLIGNPRLLLLDEVSLGLAPVVIREIYRTIPSILAEGTTVVVVEQDIGQAAAVSDRYYCLARGRVALAGRTADLDREALTSAYFGIAG